MTPEEAAARLDDAALHLRPIGLLSCSMPLDHQSAYEIQNRLLHRMRERGAVASGLKLSRAPTTGSDGASNTVDICGQLTEDMELLLGEAVSKRAFIRPHVQAALAFLLSRAVEPNEPPSRAVRAVEAVACTLEVTDSRYLEPATLFDLAADNASACRYTIGPWHSWPVDTSNLGILVEVEGRVSEIASTAAILGGPGRTITTAAHLAEAVGASLAPGSLVVAATATPPVALPALGEVRVVMERLGQCNLIATPGTGVSLDDT